MIEIRPFVKVLGVPWFYPEPPEPAEPPAAEKEIRLINSRGEVISVSVTSTSRGAVKPWTKEEDELLIKHFATMTYEELVNLFPRRTIKSIRLRAHRLKLKKSRDKLNWSEAEVKRFTRDYPWNSNTALARKYGVSRPTIDKRAAKMGLKKDPRYIQSLKDKIRGWKL